MRGQPWFPTQEWNDSMTYGHTTGIIQRNDQVRDNNRNKRDPQPGIITKEKLMVESD